MFIIKTTSGDVKIDYDEFAIAQMAFDNRKKEDATLYLRNGIVNPKYIISIIPDEIRRKRFIDAVPYSQRNDWMFEKSVDMFPKIENKKQLNGPKS